MMNKFIIRQFWKQHKSFKPRFHSTGTGSRLQRKQSPRVISKHKFSNLVKFNKFKQGKDFTYLKKQIFSFLSYLTWQRLANPIVELVLPSLIQKNTFPNINSLSHFNNLGLRNEPESGEKCCEQPKPFDIGEKIGPDYSVRDPFGVLGFGVSEKSKKVKAPLLTKNYLYNGYLPLKNIVGSKIQRLIPNLSQDHTLEKIGDFRHNCDGLNIEYNFLFDSANPSSCKTILMGKDKSQVSVNELEASLPLAEMELDSHFKSNEMARMKNEKNIGSKLMSNQKIKSSMQLKNKRNTQIVREKFDINLKQTEKINRKPLNSIQRKKGDISEQLSPTNLPSPVNSSQNKKNVSHKNKGSSTESFIFLEDSLKPHYTLQLKVKKGKKRKRAAKKMFLTRKSNNIIGIRQTNKEYAEKEGPKSIDSKVTQVLKDSTMMVEKELIERTETQDFLSRAGQNRKGKTESLKQSKENLELAKADKTVFKPCNTIKCEGPLNLDTNQTSLGRKQGSPTLSKSKPFVCDKQSSGFPDQNLIKQPKLHNHLNSMAEFFKPKPEKPNNSMNPFKCSKLSESNCNGIKDKTSFESNIFKEENDCLQSTRYMLRKLQETNVMSRTVQEKNLKDNKVVVNMERNTLLNNEGNVSQLKYDAQNSTKTPTNTQKDIVIKSNFVVFDTNGKGGHLLIKEQNVALGEGVRNDLVSFEHVLQEEAKLRSFNKSKEKPFGKKSQNNGINDSVAVLKPWKRQKENLEIKSNIIDNEGRKKEETLNSTELSNTNTLRDYEIKTTLENKSINSFCDIDKKLPSKETENNETKVKEHKILNKNVSDINFNNLAKAVPSPMKGKKLDGKTNQGKSKHDNYGSQKIFHVTLPSEDSLKDIKKSTDVNNLQSVDNYKKLDDHTAVNSNLITHLKPAGFTSNKEKSSLKNLDIISEVKHKLHAKQNAEIEKRKSETKADHLLSIDNLHMPDPTGIKHVKLRQNSSYHNQSTKECIESNKFELISSKTNKLKVEVGKDTKRPDEYENALKKTVSSLPHTLSDVSVGKAKRSTTSTSLDEMGEKYSRDTVEYNERVVSNNKHEVKSTNKAQETKINPAFKETKPKIHISKKNHQKLAKRAQSETNKHSNHAYHKSNNYSANSGNAKNKVNNMISKPNKDELKASRSEIKVSKSSSLNSIKTEQTKSLKDTYKTSSKMLNENMKSDKKQNTLFLGTVKVLEEDIVEKKPENIKLEEPAAMLDCIDNSKISHTKNIVKHASDLNLSHVKLAKLNSINQVSKGKSLTIVSALKDATIVNKQRSNITGKTEIRQNHFYKTNIIIPERDSKMSDKTSKNPETGLKSVQIYDKGNGEKQPDEKFENTENSKNRNNSDDILKISDQSVATALLKNSKSDKNFIQDNSKVILSEKKKLKSKLKKLLQGLSITGQQHKSVKIHGVANSQGKFKKDTNSGTFLQDPKQTKLETQPLVKNKYDQSCLTSPIRNIASKTEVLKPINSKHKKSTAELVRNKSAWINDRVEEKKSVLEKNHNSETSNEVGKMYLSNNQKTSELSKVKANINTNTKLKLKVRQTSLIGKELATQNVTQTKMRNIAKIVYPAQISKEITKQQVFSKVESGKTYNNSKPYKK